MGDWIRLYKAGMPVPPDTLVHVQFRDDGEELCDEHLPPLPASWWSPCWHVPHGRIYAYRVANQDNQET